MYAENRAANGYNKHVNEKWFAYQRGNGKDRQAPAQTVGGKGRGAEQREAPERAPEGGGGKSRPKEHDEPQRRPSTGMPEKGEVKIELRGGFNTDIPVSAPRNQARAPMQQERGGLPHGLKQDIGDVNIPPRGQARPSLDERLARPDHPRTQEMRASSRDLLQRLDQTPQRPQPGHELNRPHGLER
jgi:hypothetical protein